MRNELEMRSSHRLYLPLITDPTALPALLSGTTFYVFKFAGTVSRISSSVF